MLENLQFLKTTGGAFFTFLGGFLIAYIARYLPSAKKQRSEDFKLLIESYQKQYKDIMEEVKSYKQKEQECLDRYSGLEVQLLKLQSNMSLLRASSPNIPIPMWVKDINGIMLALNDEYERAFLMPQGKRREDSVGKTDDDIWGSEMAIQLRESDMKAIDQDEPVIGIETIRIGDEKHPKLWNIIKYPNKIGDLVVTIGGIAFPEPKHKQIRRR